MSTKFKVVSCLIVIVAAIFMASKPGQISNQKPVAKATLSSVVTQAMAGTQGTYGIAIKNLKTGETFYSNEHRVFQPGSLYKLWIMGETFNQIKKGEISEDEILSKDVAQLNTDFGIDPQSAELTEGTITLSIRDALDQMITISHNYAAFLLTEKIKLASVQPFLDANNLIESNVGTTGQPPTTTASDVAKFFEKLYKDGREPIALLKRQQLNDVIPKYLPENVVVAHKTGNIDNFDNDAGIVYGPKGDYIIVVLSESDNPPGAEERMAQLSKAVYDYFSSQTNPGK